MVIELKNEQGIVLIWLTKSEADDPKTDAYVKALCPEYRAKGYLVAVMRSGSADLYEQTRNLLTYNRRRDAERQVRAERELIR